MSPFYRQQWLILSESFLQSQNLPLVSLGLVLVSMGYCLSYQQNRDAELLHRR